MSKSLRDVVAEDNPEALFADGLDDAVLGMAHVFDGDGHRDVVAYDYDACIAVFMRGGMTEEDAEEWMEFNVIGAYAGAGTPVFVRRMDGSRGMYVSPVAGDRACGECRTCGVPDGPARLTNCGHLSCSHCGERARRIAANGCAMRTPVRRWLTV